MNSNILETACCHTLDKRGHLQPLVKGMNHISFGMDDAEEKWWPNKPLDKYSPAWMWKLQRQHLAKGENRNKAGRKKGLGPLPRPEGWLGRTSSLKEVVEMEEEMMEMMVGTLGKGIGTGTTLGKEIGAGGAVTPGPAGTTGMTGKMTGTGAPDKAPGKGVTAGGRGGRAEAATAVPHL